MLDASSAGRGQPKTRSINVEANLLSERAAELSRVHEQINQRLILIGTVLGLAVLSIPPIWTWQSRAAKSAAAAMTDWRRVHGQLEDLNKAQTSAQPVMLQAQMKKSASISGAMYLGRIMEFLNCADDNVTLLSFAGQVQGGELRIGAKGAATTNGSYQSFIGKLQSKVGEDKVVPRSIHLSMEPNAGATFELTYSARVTL